MPKHTKIQWARALAAVALAGCSAFVWAMPESRAATWYWDTTTTGLWTNSANWSDNAVSGGTNGTPANDTTTDVAFFNQSSVNGNQIVQLGAARSINGIIFANTGSTSIRSDSSTARQLTLGSGGLTVQSGAGSVTLGDATNTVNLAIAATQTLTNNSSNTLTVLGTISRSSGDTTTRDLTVAGSGTTSLHGVISNGGGASGSIAVAKSGPGLTVLTAANTYTGTTSVNAGTLQIGNAGTTGALSTSSAITGLAGATLAFNRTNTVTQGTDFNSVISGEINVSQRGTGTLVLNSANVYTGTTSVNSGTLQLNFNAAGAPASNIVNNASNSSPLALGGGTLVVAGKNSGESSQQFNGLTVNRGASAITATIGTSGTVNMALGGITRNTGGVVNFMLPATGTISTTTANANFSGGQQTILAGYATVGGTTWAVSAGDGTNPGGITGLATYNSGFGAGTDVNVSSGASNPATMTVNSIRFNAGSAATVTLGGTMTVATGGILTTSNVAAINNITGGALTSGNGTDLVFFQNSNTHQKITSPIVGSIGFTKAGAGTVRLTGSNTYTGPTNILAGQLSIGDNVFGNDVSSLSPSSTIYVASGATFGVDLVSGYSTSTSVQGVRFGTITGEGNFSQTRGGVVVLTNDNTYAGSTSMSGGILQISSIGSWSAGNTTPSSLGSPTSQSAGLLTLRNGTLVYTGTGETTNRDVIGDPSSAAATFTIDQSGTVGALVFTGTLRSDGSGGGTQTLQLQGSTAGNGEIAGVIVDKMSGRFTAVTKTGAGTWRLSSGTNTYGGVTTINGGVLEASVLANGGALSSTGTSSNAASNLVINGGTLRYIGSGGSSDRNFTTGTSGATIDASGSGAFTLSGSSAFAVSNTAARLTFTGTSTAANTFSGSLGNNGTGMTSLVKSGAGTWVFSGANTFSGSTTISAGILSITSTSVLGSTSGVGIANGARLRYTGASSVFDRNVTVTTASGTGTIENSGGGTLTLAGTLSKDNSVLRLTGGSFNVTGLITGTTVGASDLVVDAADVMLSNTNTYNGPTFVYNSGTLKLGVSNAIPSNSVVTLGNSSGAGTLVTSTFTNAIGGLAFSGSGGTLKLTPTASQTSTSQLSSAGSVALSGAPSQLDLTGMATGAGVYRLVSAASLTGTFGTVTGLDSSYVLRYGTLNANSLDAQRRADQASTFTMTTGTVMQALVNSTVSLSGTITNSSPAGSSDLVLGLGSTGQLSVTGLSTGAIAPGVSTAIGGLLNTGSTAGSRTWSVVNTDNAAITTTSTATGSFTVYDAATAQLAYGGLESGTNWTISLGEFNQGAGTSTPWEFAIANLLQSELYTADLSLASFSVAQDSGAIFTDLSGTSFTPALQAGGTNAFTAWMSLSTAGMFTNVYNLSFTSAKNGAVLGGTQNIRLEVTGIIVVPEPGGLALAGIGVWFAGWLACNRRRRP